MLLCEYIWNGSVFVSVNLLPEVGDYCNKYNALVIARINHSKLSKFAFSLIIWYIYIKTGNMLLSFEIKSISNAIKV